MICIIYQKLTEESMSNSTFHKSPHVEVLEIISAEHRCFRDSTFFSSDSENMENISAD